MGGGGSAGARSDWLTALASVTLKKLAEQGGCVTAHFFICALAYDVRWFMERAWVSITFADEHATDLERDPVAPVKRAQAAIRKAQTGKLENGEVKYSFASLLADLGTIERTTCRDRISGATFRMLTTPTDAQQHALNLRESITV